MPTDGEIDNPKRRGYQLGRIHAGYEIIDHAESQSLTGECSEDYLSGLGKTDAS